MMLRRCRPVGAVDVLPREAALRLLGELPVIDIPRADALELERASFRVFGFGQPPEFAIRVAGGDVFLVTQ